VDDSTRQAVLTVVQAEVARLWDGLVAAEGLELATAERQVRDGLLAVGAQLLEAVVAARGPGKLGPHRACPCGGQAPFVRYRRKQVQTLLGWITVRRAAYACPVCGHGHCPLDAVLGLERDSHSPGVRHLACRFGARQAFAQAAADLLAATGVVRLSASTVRILTEGVGAAAEADLAMTLTTAWATGLPPAAGPAPERLVIAMDGCFIRGVDGVGREVKVGVVQPVRPSPRGARQEPASYVAGWEPASYVAGWEPASYVAGWEPAAAFGRRLALEAHQRGAETARAIAVLGDGAAWIWTLAAEHFPGATLIVDWYHASARIWELGQALFGEAASETAGWVDQQLGRLAAGEAATLAQEWQGLPTTGAAATVRDEQVTYFTNQAPRMAYDQYRAAGWAIGSGMVESAGKQLIGAREKGAGMRWTEAGAQAVAAVRVAFFNAQWAPDALAA
jgi:hypothetical protein